MKDGNALLREKLIELERRNQKLELENSDLRKSEKRTRLRGANIPKPRANGARGESRPGVYFAWDGDEVVYVGVSGDVRCRLAHHRTVEDWMLVSWISFETRLEAAYWELFYIWKLRPKLNKVSSSSEEDPIDMNSLESMLECESIFPICR